MKLEKLLNEKKIEIDYERIEKDLKSAKDSLKNENFEWALFISYHAVLRIGMNLMSFMGYRAIGKEHHKNVFRFLKEFNINKELVEYFNKIGVKRNNFIYGIGEKISQQDAEESIEKAKEFVQKIRTFVQKIRTDEKD